jgi:hypothetical protein
MCDVWVASLAGLVGIRFKKVLMKFDIRRKMGNLYSNEDYGNARYAGIQRLSEYALFPTPNSRDR